VDGNGARAVDEVRISLSFPVFLTHNSTSPGSINSPRQNPRSSRKDVRPTHTLPHVLKYHRHARARTRPGGNGQYSALCLLNEERGEVAKMLNAWSKCVVSASLHPESSTEIFVSWTESPMQNGQTKISKTRYHPCPLPLPTNAIGN
jgi:hypothetical protein